ncbi:hypothetical protein Tsubulata_022736 [Turnera subulata]|uniref:Rx N-terminal domain-containing protein n=1 Tax=Turnera subulata TaxID=218843 RepID=A0A9Q0F1I5_9ROSI|nr:hypothetical protein Tsubulata_022736 [Turnera subulata]
MRAGAVAFSMVEGAVGCFKGSTKLDDRVLWKLKSTVMIVNERINSAEEKQRAIPAVRWWLHEQHRGKVLSREVEWWFDELKKAANDATTLLEELTHDHESLPLKEKRSTPVLLAGLPRSPKSELSPTPSRLSFIANGT